MEENQQIAMQIDAKKYLENLRGRTNYPEEVYELVRNDLEYGLNKEQIKGYLKDGYDVSRMKIHSRCLRKGGCEKFLEMADRYNAGANQMQVALEFYEKGVGLAEIETVLRSGEIPVAMKAAFEKLLQKVEAAKKAASTEPEYVQGVIRQIEEAVAKITRQDQKYDELSKKISELAAGREDEEVRRNLVSQLDASEKTVSDQQDQLNQANATIARLRNESENKDKEIRRMEKRIDTLEERLLNAGVPNKKEAGAEPDTGKRDSEPEPPIATHPIPVCYQVPVVDMQGRYVRHVQVERTARKTSGIGGLLASLGFKKKSRADIVKLVAGGDLAPAQLVQIKSAIEKGLTESQLVELINNNVAAEKMKEIIEIAVLENSLRY